MSHWLDFIQWPAMVTNVWAAWLIASHRETRRKIGFYVFLIGNLLGQSGAGDPAPGL